MYNLHLNISGLSSYQSSRLAFERSVILPAASYSFLLEKVSFVMGVIGGGLADPNPKKYLGLEDAFGLQEISHLWEYKYSRDFILSRDIEKEILNVAFVKLDESSKDQTKEEKWYPRFPKLYNQHLKDFYLQTGALCGYDFIPFPKSENRDEQDRQVILSCYPHDFRDTQTNPMQIDCAIKDKFFAMLVNKKLLDEQTLFDSGIYLGVNVANIQKHIVR